MTDQTQSKQPDYMAYSVKNYAEGKSSWNRIGAAWANQDGEGFNIVLDSLPVDGRVTLRLPKQEEEQSQE